MDGVQFAAQRLRICRHELRPAVKHRQRGGFDYFRVEGFGPSDRAAFFCVGGGCANGTTRTGYIAGAPDGNATCEACAPGQYDHDNWGASPCVLCPRGLFSDATGATECSGMCPVGTFALDTGGTDLSVCQTCAPGRFDNDTDVLTQCIDCPLGQVVSVHGATECEQCANGTWAEHIPLQTRLDSIALVMVDVVDGVVVFGGTASYSGRVESSPAIVAGPTGQMDALNFNSHYDRLLLGNPGDVGIDGPWTVDCWFKTPVPYTSSVSTLVRGYDEDSQVCAAK